MANKKSTAKPAEKTAKKPGKEPDKKPAKAKEAKAEKAVKAAKTAEEETTKKSKKGLLIGLIIGALVLIVGAIIAVLCINSKVDPTDPKASLSYSNAFFIYDNGKYTFWNADGERVVEDEFDSKSDLVGGYAMVKKDDQYGIIKESGKMSVDFGKYGNITAGGGLYLAQDGNTKEYYLLTGAGQELARGDNLKIAAPMTGAFAVVSDEEQLRVYTFDGKLLVETSIVEGDQKPAYTTSHDFGAFYYNNQNWIFDVRDGKVLATFEGPKYDFEGVTDDRDKVLLQNTDDKEKYKLLADGKVYDLDETKYYVFTALGDLVGYDDYSEIALLNSDYKVAKRVSDYLALKDTDNYATENKDGKAEIYRNGELIKTFGDDSSLAASGVLYEDYYAIEEGDKAQFYNLDGTAAFNHEYKEILSLFNKHHHAIVSDEEDKYYLINADGQRIGDIDATAIYGRDGGYEFKNSDGKYAIANKKGELVTDFKYASTYYRSGAELNDIWTGRSSDDNYDVIDAENGKVLLENVNAQSFYTHYFTIKNKDKKTEYYTYEGKLFYTSENS